MLGFKQVADDNLYNRRRLAVFSFIFAVTWCYLIIGIDFFMDMQMDAAKLTVYMGAPGVISGLPIWQYFRAANEDTK